MATVRISAETAEVLRQTAEAEGRSQSMVVARALRQYLEMTVDNPDPARRQHSESAIRGARHAVQIADEVRGPVREVSPDFKGGKR